MLAAPTLDRVRPDRPAPGAAPAAPAETPAYYVLTVAGVLGPLTEAELTAVAEQSFALTGATVTATKGSA